MATDHETGFYSDRGEGCFDSTELTRGPWDGGSQHAGPPAALIGRAIEGCEGVGGDSGGRIVGRITFEILRPIPIAPIVVSAEVARPGRRVDMVEASLRDAEGTELAGEEPTPLQRVLIAADTGNGISSTLDFRRFVFINVDLTVHLHREPEGDWVCIDAGTVPEPTGIGMTDTQLRDVRGPIGRATQTLLIAER